MSEVSGPGLAMVIKPTMTLRDYFAAHCPSDLAKCNVQSDAEKIAGPYPPDEDFPAQLIWNNKVEAFLRYAYADAMLHERLTDRFPNSAIESAVKSFTKKSPREWQLLLTPSGEVQAAIRVTDARYVCVGTVHVREVLP